MSHVLIVSHDVVDRCMAGPGIRYWELARVLARQFEVTLLVPGGTSLACPELDLRPYSPDRPEDMLAEIQRADVVLSYGFSVGQWPFLAEMSVPWVADVYVPELTENLEWFPSRPLAERESQYRTVQRATALLAGRADFYLCATERQRDFWLGVLAAHNRLSPAAFDRDPTFRHLVDVVPFGLPSTPPRHRKPALREIQPGCKAEDPLIVWGGGLWDWLDPLTLLHAMARLVKVRPDARLAFPGTRHPNAEQVPDMAIRKQTIALMHELRLESHVFMGEWAPYAERENYLLEADVGVSLHSSRIESRYAFRTRLLDYIWAGLPMVVSSGDPLSELVASEGLGILVDPGDEEQVYQALLALLADPHAREVRRQRFEAVRERFTWERVAEPLIRFCHRPYFGLNKQQGTIARAGQDAWERERAAQAQEIERLSAEIAAFRRGRFIRLTAWLDRLRRRAHTAAKRGMVC